VSCSFYTYKYGYYCMKKGDNVNEDIYYKYCRNYDYADCPIYKGADTSGGCYLTSACVYARGLPDDCHELQTLRHFRDTWLKQQENGPELIAEYYAIAPKIVSAINDRPDSQSVYNKIYETIVMPCVKLIEGTAHAEALSFYKSMTAQLYEEYV